MAKKLKNIKLEQFRSDIESIKNVPIKTSRNEN